MAGILQEVLRIATHAPSGRPRFVSSAIRRSLVVGIMATRVSWRSFAPIAAVAGWVAVALTLSRAFLGARGLSHDDNSPGLLLAVEALLAVWLFSSLTIINPLLRRVRLLL